MMMTMMITRKDKQTKTTPQHHKHSYKTRARVYLSISYVINSFVDGTVSKS